MLGFFFADGYVSGKSNQINICSIDIDMLLKFKELLKIDKELYSNPNHLTAKTLYFSSIKMKQDLMNLGCFPKKSLTLDFVNENKIPKNLMNHFIRGYFDGDGSVYGKKQIQVKIMSSTKFCSKLVLFLNNLGIKCGKLMNDANFKKETSYFRITGKQNLENFYNFLYKDSTIFLNRKKEKFKLN